MSRRVRAATPDLEKLVAPLRSYAAADEEKRPRLELAARKAAEQFLERTASLDEATRADLAELRGWCEAVVGGWVLGDLYSTGYEIGDLADVCAEAFSTAPTVDGEAASTFETASVDHVVEMVMLQVVVAAVAGSTSGVLEGAPSDGLYHYDDQSESRIVIGWNEHGLAGLAFHKYTGKPEEDPLDLLPGLPAALRPLAAELAEHDDGWFSTGFWITRDGRRGRYYGVGEHDGTEHVAAFTSSPRAALFDGPGSWGERYGISEEVAAVARELAKRIMSGGGQILTAESTVLLQGVKSKELLPRVGRVFAKLGLRWLEAGVPAEQTSSPPPTRVPQPARRVRARRSTR